MYMETESEARKRFQNSQYRRQYFQRTRSNSRDSCYSGSQRQSHLDGPRRDSRDAHSHDRSRFPDPRERNPQSFPRCIGCQCGTCNQIKTDFQDIKKLLEKLDMKRIHEVSIEESSATAINLCSQE